MYTLWLLGDTLTALTVTSSPTTMDVLVALSSPLGVTVGVGVGGVLTVIVMLSSSLPVMLPARSSTVPLPPSQPYTVSVASDGGSTNRVPSTGCFSPGQQSSPWRSQATATAPAAPTQPSPSSTRQRQSSSDERSASRATMASASVWRWPAWRRHRKSARASLPA